MNSFGGNGVFGILIVVGGIVLLYCMTFAPLYIWKWTKANNRELRKQTKLLKAIASGQGAKVDEQSLLDGDSVADAKKFSASSIA